MAADHVFAFTTAAAPPPPRRARSSSARSTAAAATPAPRSRTTSSSSTTGPAHPISLAGWSVQYASAAGTTWPVTPLTGSIPAGRNYLVKEAAGAGGTVDLPAPDATGTIAMSGTAGKVALVSTTTALAGACPTGATISRPRRLRPTANCFERRGPTAGPEQHHRRAAQRRRRHRHRQQRRRLHRRHPRPARVRATRRRPSPSTTPANGATGVALGATDRDHLQRAGERCRRLVHHQLRHERRPRRHASTGGPTSFTLDPTADFARTSRAR